jgi:hypothetical protein
MSTQSIMSPSSLYEKHESMCYNNISLPIKMKKKKKKKKKKKIKKTTINSEQGN